MKRLAILIAAFFLFGGMVSDGAAQVRHFFRDQGFSIEIPKEWVKQGIIDIKESKYWGVVFERSASDSADQVREMIAINVDKLSRPCTLEEYFNANLGSQKLLFDNLEQPQIGYVRVGEEKSKWLLSSSKLGPVETKQMFYFFVKGSSGYSFFYTSSPGLFEKYEAQFRSVVGSLRFE